MKIALLILATFSSYSASPSAEPLKSRLIYLIKTMTKTKTLEQHFKRFDYVNSDIKNGLFPLLEVSDKLEYKVFHFDRYISSEEAVAKIRTEGFDPATFSELLAWPDWDEKELVVALGSVGEVRGRRGVPFLSRLDSRRRLSLGWWGDLGWRGVCRFLGVRNLSSDSQTSEIPKLCPSIPLTLERIEKKLDLLLKHFNN